MKKQKLFAAALSLSFALGAISPVFAEPYAYTDWDISDEDLEAVRKERQEVSEKMRKLIEEDDYENSNKPSEKPNPPKKEDQASSGQVVDDGPCSEEDGFLIEKSGPSIEKGDPAEVKKLPSLEDENPKEIQPKEPMVKLAKSKNKAKQTVKTANFLIEKYPNTVKRVRPQLEKLIKEAEELIRKADELLAKYKI